MTDIQKENAFQKQRGIFLNAKVNLSQKKRITKKRYYKDAGLGFKAPKEAIEGSYIDKKCPFTGGVSIRGKILKGVVASTKMNRTVIVRRDYLHYIKKYQRYEKRHKNIPAHCSPCFRVEVGDEVTIGECRPLSKTIRFNVLRVQKGKKQAGDKKKFVLY